MVRPTSEQVVYIDLSAPDTVTVYEEDTFGSGAKDLFQGAQEVIESIIEYFR